MIPTSHYQLALLIHEERIRAAQAPRPEWMYTAALPGRPRHRPSASRQLRHSVAQALRRIAASVEPSGVESPGKLALPGFP
jgi:hypothetical protein